VVKPLKRFYFTKFSMEEGVQVPHRHAKSPKLVIFLYKFAQRGIPPQAIFTKFGMGEGVPAPHPHAKFHRCGL